MMSNKGIYREDTCAGGCDWGRARGLLDLVSFGQIGVEGRCSSGAGRVDFGVNLARGGKYSRAA